MASAFVFPGGQVELSDFDYRWYGLFSKYGLSPEALNSSVSDQIVGPRPPIVQQSITLRKHTGDKASVLNPDIALRIAAIRETFEEAGNLHFLKLSSLQFQKTNFYTMIRHSSAYLNKWSSQHRTDFSRTTES